MADGFKNPPGSVSINQDLQTLFSPLKTKRTKAFAYGFLSAFIIGTVFLAFNPNSTVSPLYNGLLGATSSATASARSQFSSVFSLIIQGNLRSAGRPSAVTSDAHAFTDLNAFSPVRQYHASKNCSSDINKAAVPTDCSSALMIRNGTATNGGKIISSTLQHTSEYQLEKPKGEISSHAVSPQAGFLGSRSEPSNQSSVVRQSNNTSVIINTVNQTGKFSDIAIPTKNGANFSGNVTKEPISNGENRLKNSTGIPQTETKYSMIGNETGQVAMSTVGREISLNALKRCNIFDGRWVRDDSYPLYKEGSCNLIDESFDCFRNGRPDLEYQKLRWQPNGCNIPRLNASDMLQRLRGKRLVFIGDSLNRNMWESLICILRNSVVDKSKVFEMSGRREFRTEGSYSFLFKDYDCTVEFFRSPFLVQEWEMPESNGSKKETLRLDLIERQSDRYKNADILIFNTGHWWTHEKTSKGKDYYQEGSHVYGQLNVVEAFRKALVTWGRWVDANVNRNRTLVFFRGYSASHFRGGPWNSGGACDKETEPFDNDRYLMAYPPKMSVLESVVNGMKTPVVFMNITRMTDYRKDAHPSIYRQRDLPIEERRSPEIFQDCSHWCLPGVPDSWNELVYAQLLLKLH